MDIPDEYDYSKFKEMIKSDYPPRESLESQKEKIISRDWDKLIVLDACRADALSLALEDVQMVVSPGNETARWLNNLWDREGFEDVNYISGSPVTKDGNVGPQKRAPDMNERVNLIQADEAWDGTLGTSRPEKLIDVEKKYDTPKVVHFMQPHVPFIGEILFGTGWGGIKDLEMMEGHKGGTRNLNENGHISNDFVQLAYYANMIHALKQIARNMEKEGKTVITADHGRSLAGEKSTDLQIVPWLEI